MGGKPVLLGKQLGCRCLEQKSDIRWRKRGRYGLEQQDGLNIFLRMGIEPAASNQMAGTTNNLGNVG
jgi:hypothetical protein